MAEEIFYEFDNFRLDPVRRKLLHGAEARPLTPTACDLLVAFVQNHGQTISKAELIKWVWAVPVVTDNNFSVNLNAVRRALGESGRLPHYIVKTPGGYRFIADVREVRMETSGDETNTFGKGEDPGDSSESKINHRHFGHICVASLLYAALYVTSLFLEVAYEFDRFSGMAWRVAPLVFAWMTVSSVAGLTAGRALTSRGRAHGLPTSVAIFLISAALLLLVLTYLLPASPITQSTLQSYPAQAAYLKDTAYFLVVAFGFLILPLHFIVTIERGIQVGDCDHVLRLLTGDKMGVSPTGTIYPRFWALVSVLVVLGAFSLVMTSRLLDHLKPSPFMNLFTQLVYLRGILYFGLGIECLVWYYRALEGAKQQCISRLDTPALQHR
jgi:DNA-binding winged helix-turn-helix (wHTH) protein